MTHMIRGFAGQGTEDIFNGVSSKAARKVCPAALRRRAELKLDMLNRAPSLQSLRTPPGNHLEALTGDRAGQHAIRVNDQYRLCFRWDEDGAHDVEIVDYH